VNVIVSNIALAVMLQISQAIQCIMVTFYVKHYGYKDCDRNMLKGYALHTVAREKTNKERLKRARQNKFALGEEQR
jgi:hypothetical protein